MHFLPDLNNVANHPLNKSQWQTFITSTVECSEDLFCIINTITLMQKHLIQRSRVEHNTYK